MGIWKYGGREREIEREECRERNIDGNKYEPVPEKLVCAHAHNYLFLLNLSKEVCPSNVNQTILTYDTW